MNEKRIQREKTYERKQIYERKKQWKITNERKENTTTRQIHEKTDERKKHMNETTDR